MHPEKVSKLILYGTYARGGDVLPLAAQQNFVELTRNYWGRAAEVFTQLFIPEPTPEDWEWVAFYQRASSSGEMATTILEQMFALDVSEDARKVACPTLIMHRRQDTAVGSRTSQRLKELIPQGKLVLLQGKIHLPWLEDTQSVLEEVFGFLE